MHRFSPFFPGIYTATSIAGTCIPAPRGSGYFPLIDTSSDAKTQTRYSALMCNSDPLYAHHLHDWSPPLTVLPLSAAQGSPLRLKADSVGGLSSLEKIVRTNTSLRRATLVLYNRQWSALEQCTERFPEESLRGAEKPTRSPQLAWLQLRRPWRVRQQGWPRTHIYKRSLGGWLEDQQHHDQGGQTGHGVAARS